MATTQQLISIPELQALGFARFRDRAWRAMQAEVTERILNSPKRFIVIQAPTGFGKSPVSMAAGKLIRPKTNRVYGAREYGPQSAVLTATKMLQGQYTGEFADFTAEVRGRSNFDCLVEPELTAADGLCAVMVSNSDEDRCPKRDHCPYFVQRDMALVAPHSTHSYAYFLNSANHTGYFGQQSLLVLDEGHLIDDMLMGFIAVTITDRACAAFHIPLPGMPGTEIEWDDWCEWAETNKPDIIAQLEDIEPLIKSSVAHRRLYRTGAALVESMRTILRSPAPWICEPVKGKPSWELKPTWVGQLANENLYRHGRKVVIMSATILDYKVFCELIGIDPEDVEYIDVPSSFPLGRKPVYYDPAWYGKRGADLAPLVQKVTEIVRSEVGNKGLIHCVSYEVATAIRDGVPPDVAARLMTHTTADRIDVYEEFRRRTDDPVLLSPSMKEGVSLEEDQCRFIVVAKLPYPYLGSPQIRARMDTPLGKRWYPWKTGCDLIQMTGRGMRSAEDSCRVYLLDAAFGRLYEQIGHTLPGYWVDDLVDVQHRLSIRKRSFTSTANGGAPVLTLEDEE